jgi:ABC-type glutathione transport system ATPase component
MMFYLQVGSDTSQPWQMLRIFVFSTVDAHTAHHLYHECLKGDLMRGRTVILVSHHVQLCAQGAEYIVSLDNGRIQFQGDYESFKSSGVMRQLVQSAGDAGPTDDKEDAKAAVLESSLDKVVPHSSSSSRTSSIPGTPIPEVKREYKPPRKLVEEEKRAVGRISRDVWETYFEACGNIWYWAIFITLLSIGAFSPVLEFGWLK